MFTFFMIVAGVGMMLSLIAFLASHSEVKELEHKLESQRQKREIDEGKRCELRSQLDTAILQIECLQETAKEFRDKADCPKHALQVLTTIVTEWEND